MGNYGYRFSCEDRGIGYLSQWGYKNFDEAKESLEGLILSCSGEGVSMRGCIYEVESSGGRNDFKDMVDYEFIDGKLAVKEC